MNFKSMSETDLANLIDAAKKELNGRKQSEMTTTVREMEALAASRGFDLQDLMQAAMALRKKAPKVPPKYRDPSNPNVTWSGRGKQPVWFREGLQQGKTAQDFLIQKD